jgi:hypothetical protein
MSAGEVIAMHTTYFRGIFAVGTKQKKAEGEQGFAMKNTLVIGFWLLHRS